MIPVIELNDCETIRVESNRDMAKITLCRNGVRNAVSLRMLEELIIVSDWLRSMDDIHFVIIDHEGLVFSAGADFKEAAETYRDKKTAMSQVRLKQRVAQEAIEKLFNIDQISFASLRGSAYGAGVAIALSCDIRVMANNAIMTLPESRLGMFLSYGITPRLVSLIGSRSAKEMILFAEEWSADYCLKTGVVDEIGEEPEVSSIIDEKIDILRKRDWSALRIAKKTINGSGALNFGNMVLTEPELAALSFTNNNVHEQIVRQLTFADKL